MININEILKILPHRYPFILIDRIIHIDPPPAGASWVGRKATAIKNVTMNENFFPGHFPEMPIMPGVLQIEAMAQTAAICGNRPPTPDSQIEVLIISIDNARFRRPVIPGDRLEIVVECTRDRGSLFGFHCEARVDGQLATEADIMAKTFVKQVKK
jgi:3-hydroxyacyl-[acyl-carrier-protein] dehydratase